MAELSTVEPALPASSRPFQFRLSSIFILMALVAFAFGLVPLWYRNVIIASKNSGEFAPYEGNLQSAEAIEGYNKEQRRKQFEQLLKHIPTFSILAFGGCCGIWFACARPTGEKSDLWLGFAFALPLVFVAVPRFWGGIYLIIMRYALSPWGLSENSFTQSTFWIAVAYMSILFHSGRSY